MLHILFIILKIIGMILLCILGLLLVLLLCVLFVPLRYKGSASIKHEIVAKAKFSWLFHIISIQIFYKDEVNFILKIFGIHFYNHKKKLEKETKNNKKRESSNKKQRKLKKEKVIIEEKILHGKQILEQKEPEDNEKTAVNHSSKQTKTTRKSKEDNLQTNNSFFKKLVIFIKKIISVIMGIFVKIRNIKYTIKKICDKMKNIRDIIYYYVDLMEKEESKEALDLCKTQLIRFFNHIKPRKLKAHVIFGTGDPATTGQILGYASMFYPIYGKNVSLIPDFMNEIFEGDIYLKGRIRAYILIRIGWKVMFNKNLKKFIKLLKREAI